MSLGIARAWQTATRRHSQPSLRVAIIKSLLCRQYATPASSAGTRNLIKPPIHGQPLAETHPHLIAPTELTPGIPKAEYEERRARLMDSLPKGSLVVCMTVMEERSQAAECARLFQVCLGGNIKYMSQGTSSWLSMHIRRSDRRPCLEILYVVHNLWEDRT